jgi:hypothetical protein
MSDQRLHCRHTHGPVKSAPQPLLALQSVPQGNTAQAAPVTERRQDDPRWPQSIHINFSALSPTNESLVIVLDGTIVNTSRGGVCISTAWPLIPSSCLRCEVALADELARVPTLVQVVWVNPMRDGTHLCGLRYLV